MGVLLLSALLVTSWAWSARAAESPTAVPAPETLSPSVDLFELEHRVLQLMIENNALRRRRAALSKKIESEIDPATRARFFDGDGITTGVHGVYVDENTMRVIGVVRGSPGHVAGLQENDRLLEINDTVGGETQDASARLLWAMRRMKPGDLSSVTFLRGDERHTAQLPVIGRKQLRRIQERENGAAGSLNETEIREQEREYWISRRQRYGVRAVLAEQRLGVWDGLILMSIAGGLGNRLETQIGVLVLESSDSDHPLRAGDVITRIGHNSPSDAQHAVRLLYDYENLPLIPLSIERAGNWLALELPYPAGERMP